VMYDFLLVCHCNCSISCTIFELFDDQSIVTLKSRLGVMVTEGHWKLALYSIDRIRVTIRLPL